MVAYLKKPKGSEGFHQIVDFLNASHIRTLDNGEIELTAIIDGKVKIVTEASIRRHLQLVDFDGISSLPTTEIFEQLSLMGYVSTSDKLTFQKGHFSFQWNLSSTPSYIGPVVQGDGSTHPVESHHTPTSASSTSQQLISPTSKRTNRQESMVPQPRSPTQSLIADKAASIGVDVRYGGVANTVTSLEVGQGNGNIDKTPTIPHDSPLPIVNTLRSDEGSMTLQELMVLCTTLSKKVESLETNLQQTKLTYGAAYTKLIKKDPSKQGRKIAKIDQHPAISLVQHDIEIQGRHEHDMEFYFDLDAAKDVSTAEKDVSTAKPISTAGAAVTTASVAAVSTASPTRRVSITDDITMAETLVYIRKSATKDKEWEDIQSKVEANEELAQRLQSEERELYTEAEQERMLLELINQRKIYVSTQRTEERRNKPPTQAQQRTYMSNYIMHMGGYTLQKLRGYSFDEIKNLFETTMTRVHTFVLIESEIEREIPELAAGSSKRDAEEELDQETSKRQKTCEISELAEEPRDKEADELSQEELQQILIIVPEQGMNVEALQTKYPIIDWEIYTEGTRKYWKTIRVGNHTEVHQFFDDMLKALDRDDLVQGIQKSIQ
ncbi:hypothetical protein Tco_1313797 [Tanacetum coccineum]